MSMSDRSTDVCSSDLRAMIWFVMPVTVVGAIMWNISAGRSAIIALLGTDWAYSANMTDRLWPLFALGAAAYIFRSRIRLSWAMLALLFIINVVAHQWGVGLTVRALLIDRQSVGMEKSVSVSVD